MKYIFLLLITGISFFTYGMTPSSAAESENTGGLESDIVLSLISIEPIDDMHLQVTFSESVDLDTLKLNIKKQSDNSTLRFATITPVTDRPGTVEVTLESQFEEGSAYTLTIVSAIGESGAVIKDGALALKDFITPIPLKKYEVVMNAPSNPNAVLAQTGTTNTVTVTPAPVEPAVVPVVPKVEPPKTAPTVTEELPLTGMNPLYILILSLPLVLFIMRRKA
jgi:hypothetical protein